MSFLKKIVALKMIVITFLVIVFFTIIIAVATTVAGSQVVTEVAYAQTSDLRTTVTVKNNWKYASRYRSILTKYLRSKGYVSLDRLIFYLQRTNNVLDITSLPNSVWEQAYLTNLNESTKQMVPIKTMCKKLKEDKNLPLFTLSSSPEVDVIDLCTVNGKDITTSDDFSEDYLYMPFSFPLHSFTSVTSMVFEIRDVAINVPGLNYHTGWDFSTPIGTDFYSVCDGNIKKVVNTQFNNLSYNQSFNTTGNYALVACSNGLTVGYYHIMANSVKFPNGANVHEGEALGKTSTTGMSTGPHLHLEVKDSKGKVVDAMLYTNFLKN